MKQIYIDIISEGEGTIAETSGDNAKGENLGLIAGAELFRMVELFPEMLERLKRIVELQENKKLQDAYIRNMITSTIAKAEGHE